MTRALRRSILLALATASLLSACGDDSQAATNTADTADTADTAVTSAEAADGCAPADGSAARQQTFTAAPPVCLEKGASYAAVIETNRGTLHVTLRADIAPQTVNSFVNLARYHYFDGTTCHRAIQGFVVQCGDPTATGQGGPGYEFSDDPLNAGGFGPGDATIRVRPVAVRSQLIKPRISFVPEMLKSVENL